MKGLKGLRPYYADGESYALTLNIGFAFERVSRDFSRVSSSPKQRHRGPAAS